MKDAPQGPRRHFPRGYGGGRDRVDVRLELHTGLTLPCSREKRKMAPVLDGR